jgi:hypothetical protein
LGFPSFGGPGGVVTGIYTNYGGIIEKILDVNDVLDGKMLLSIGLNNESFDGSSVAFKVGFDDGTRAIYRADISLVPVPAVIGLIIVGVTGIGYHHRRAIRQSKSRP